MVAKAKVRIEGEDATAAAFRSALGNAQKFDKKIQGVLKGALLGIGVGAIAGLGREAIETGDNLNKLATRLKIAGKDASSLAYAAKQSDVELGDLTNSMQKMEVFLSKAASGEKANVEALNALGIKLEDIKDLKADQQFELIAEQVSKMKSEADQARVVTEVFGKAGGNLLPMFSQGAAGIRKARLEAEQLGLAFDDETLQKLADADDAIKRMDASWHGMWITVTSKVAPSIRSLADAISGIDTRNIDEKITDLKDAIANPVVGSARYRMSVDEMQAELDRLQGLRDVTPGAAGSGGGRTGIRGQGSSAPAGYKPSADTKAEAAAQKEREKAEQQRIDGMIQSEEAFRDSLKETRELNEDLDKSLEQSHEDAADAILGTIEEAGQALEDLEIERPWVEGMDIARDTFKTAVTDMVRNGKIQWDELGKYMLVRLAEWGIDKIMGSFGNSGTGGIFSSIGSGLASYFGGFMDSGGSGQPGKAYAITPKAGTEVFWPDSKGKFYPNVGSGGRGVTINQTNNFNGGDDQRTTQRMLAESNRRLVDEFNRTHSLAGT